MWLGNISPSITQTVGPQLMPKPMTKRLAATRAIGPQDPGSTGTSLMMSAWAKANAIVPRDTVMIAEPISSRRRRPTLSISMIAIIVAAMLVTAVITEMRNESDSWKPTACHNVVE